MQLHQGWYARLFFSFFLSPLFPGIHNEMHRGETEVFLFVMLIH